MKVLYFVTAIACAVLLVACYPCTPCPPTPICPPTVAPTPTPDIIILPTPTATPAAVLWDERLTALNIKVVSDPSARYVVKAAFLTINGDWNTAPAWAQRWATADFPERGGDHNVFGRCEDKNGNVLPKTFLLAWPDGNDARQPEASGWANIPLYAYYSPDKGECGPYTWRALNGEAVACLGLPWKNHYSFFIVWVER